MKAWMIAIVLIVFPMWSHAQGKGTLEPNMTESANVSADTVLKTVGQRYQGRALSIEQIPPKHHERFLGEVYEVRWLTPANNVLRIRIQAATGRFIEVDGIGQTEARKVP